MNDGSRDTHQLPRKDSRMLVLMTIKINRRRREVSFRNLERMLSRMLNHRHLDFILEDEREDKAGWEKNLGAFNGQGHLEVRKSIKRDDRTIFWFLYKNFALGSGALIIRHWHWYASPSLEES
jgi:hypothetical protein